MVSDIVAAVQWKIHDGDVIDHLAAVARFGFQGDGCARHRNGLGHVADSEVEVDTLARANGDSEILGDGVLNPLASAFTR